MMKTLLGLLVVLGVAWTVSNKYKVNKLAIGPRTHLLIRNDRTARPRHMRTTVYVPRPPPNLSTRLATTRLATRLVPGASVPINVNDAVGESSGGGGFGKRILKRFVGLLKEALVHDDDGHDYDSNELSNVESDSEQIMAAKRVIWMGVFGDVLLTSLKAVVGTIAHSPALVADSVHSLADIVGHFVTLLCVQLARRPSNDIFPYGFGKFETAGSLMVAFLMIGAGIELIRESVGIIAALSTAKTVASPMLLMAAGATAAAAIVTKEILFQLTALEGRRQGSPMLQTSAWHHRSDAMSSTVALVGIGGSIMGVPWADPVAGVAVAALVLSVGLQIAWKSVKELMDMSVPPTTLEKLKGLAQEASDAGFETLDADEDGRVSKEEWMAKYGTNEGFAAYDTDGNGFIDSSEWNRMRLKVSSVRARKMGPHLMLDVDVDVPSGARFLEIQKAQDKMLKHIHSANPRVREIRFQLNSSAFRT